jgi:hypothetical protein
MMNRRNFLGGLLLAACARHQGVPDDVTPMAGEVAIVVQNHNWNEVNVYILHDGVRDRLGTVTAASTQSFVVPLRRFGPSAVFRLVAMQIGSNDTYQTETLLVQAGQQITYTLESDLRRSSVMVL